MEAKSAQAFDGVMSTIRTASIRGLGGSIPKMAGVLSVFDAAPEFAFSGDDQVLVKGIGLDLDFYPLAAAANDRKHRGSRGYYPHIVLQLRHILVGRGLLGEGPWQHELSLEDRAAALDTAVKRRAHPPDNRMPDFPLDVGDDLAGIGLIPAPVELFGREPELNDQVAR
jgi:hypothetical protein